MYIITPARLKDRFVTPPNYDGIGEGVEDPGDGRR
jgi:hypothetical protein